MLLSQQRIVSRPAGCPQRRAGRLQRVVQVRAAAAPPAAASNGTTEAYNRMKGIKVIRSSDGQLVDLTTLWGPNERAVVAFGRSFG